MMCQNALRMLTLAGCAISCYAASEAAAVGDTVVFNPALNIRSVGSDRLKSIVWEVKSEDSGVCTLHIHDQFRTTHEQILAGKQADSDFKSKYDAHRKVFDLPPKGDERSFKRGVLNQKCILSVVDLGEMARLVGEYISRCEKQAGAMIRKALNQRQTSGTLSERRTVRRMSSSRQTPTAASSPSDVKAVADTGSITDSSLINPLNGSYVAPRPKPRKTQSTESICVPRTTNFRRSRFLNEIRLGKDLEWDATLMNKPAWLKVSTHSNGFEDGNTKYYIFRAYRWTNRADMERKFELYVVSAEPVADSENVTLTYKKVSEIEIYSDDNEVTLYNGPDEVCEFDLNLSLSEEEKKLLRPQKAKLGAELVERLKNFLQKGSDKVEVTLKEE